MSECPRCGGPEGPQAVSFGRARMCRKCATAPSPPLDLGALVQELDVWIAGRPVKPSPEPPEGVVTPAMLLRFLQARGLTGVVVTTNEAGQLAIVPKVVQLGFTVTKVPE